MRLHILKNYTCLSLAFLTLILLAPAQLFAEIDVTAGIEIIKGRLSYDRLAGESVFDVSIQNISTDEIVGPVKIIVDISPATVSLANANGQTIDGKGYILYGENQGLANQILAAGQTSSAITWRLTNPAASRFNLAMTVVVPDPLADADNDGVPNTEDECPNDPNKVFVGVCGCGAEDDADHDGTADCGDNCPIWYLDSDSDGYGNPQIWLTSCAGRPEGYIANPDDCDDSHWSINPTFGERCDNADSDCNGGIDDGCPSTACSTVELDQTLPCILGCDGDTACMVLCATGLSQECRSSLTALVSCLVPNGCLHSEPLEPIDQGCAAEYCLNNWRLAIGALVGTGTDLCPSDINKTSPGICGCGMADNDLNNDGIIDCLDQCPDDLNKIEPGDCGCGLADTDSDGDGTADCVDQCPNDPLKTEPGACGCGLVDDFDHDGQIDCAPDCPLWYADRDNDGYGDPSSYISYCFWLEGYAANPDDCNDSLWSVNPLMGEICDDQDSDCDGSVDEDCWTIACSSVEMDTLIPCIVGCSGDTDCAIQCAVGLSESCRQATTDLIACALENDCVTDAGLNVECLSGSCDSELQEVVGPMLINDGTDHCPSDPDKLEPGVCGCGLPDLDTDADGAYDCIDACPEDAGKTEPGTCGCGVADTDADGDDLADCVDQDWDNDGYLNENDCQPNNPLVNPSTTEICDLSDNNCNSEIDEDCLDMACTNTEIDAVQACAEDCGNNGGCLISCLPSEISNTCLQSGSLLLQCLINSDCGTMADPDFSCIQNNCANQWQDAFGEYPTECESGETRTCGSNVGICQSGVETCSDNGIWSGFCAGEIPPEPRACNGQDNDCDGEIDIDTDVYQWCSDGDGDGYIGDCTNECVVPDEDLEWQSYYDGIITDCEPTDPNSYPDAVEICDWVDNNCDGQNNEGFPDLDGDGRADCIDDDDDDDGHPDTLDCAPYDPDYFRMRYWVKDADGDQHSPTASPHYSCYPFTQDYVEYKNSNPILESDCDDDDPHVYLGLSYELCDNEKDDDCDGATDWEDSQCQD